MDASYRGEEGKRRENDFVSRPDFESVKSQEQRIGAGAAPQRITRVAIFRKFVFQPGNFLAKNHLPAAENPCDGGFNLVLNFAILDVQVTQWNCVYRSSTHSPDSLPKKHARRQRTETART